MVKVHALEEPSDEDFWELMRRLKGREVHELCAVSAVALNRDGGAGNLMLREDGWSCERVKMSWDKKTVSHKP